MSDRAQKRPESERVTDSHDGQNITQGGEDHGGTISGTARERGRTDSKSQERERDERQRKRSKAQILHISALKAFNHIKTPTNATKSNTKRFKGITGHSERESTTTKARSTRHKATRTRYNARTAHKADKHTARGTTNKQRAFNGSNTLQRHQRQNGNSSTMQGTPAQQI